MDALTGRIEFNSSGARVNYDLSLYNHGGTGLYKKVNDADLLSHFDIL